MTPPGENFFVYINETLGKCQFLKSISNPSLKSLDSINTPSWNDFASVELLQDVLSQTRNEFDFEPNKRERDHEKEKKDDGKPTINPFEFSTGFCPYNVHE